MAARHFFYDPEVLTMAQRYGLSPSLVKAMVMVESGGKTHAYRYEPGFWLRYMAHKPEYDGANPERVSASYGLMQVMYTTAVERGLVGAPEQMFVPIVGLDFGCKHLRYLLDRCDGDVEMALAQYNGGEGGNQKRPLRNEHYARKVLRWREALEDDAA